MRVLHLIVFSFLILIGNLSFSQSGTYTIGAVPPEAFKLMQDENGQWLIPPLIVGTSTIKLKQNNNVIIVHNKNEPDELKEFGTWAQSKKEGFILISVVSDSVTVTLEYEIITYESGTYLKGSNRFAYYKKKG